MPVRKCGFQAGVAESGEASRCAEGLGEASEQDVDTTLTGLDLCHAAAAGTHSAKVMRHIDDQERAILAGEGRQLRQVGDP